MDIDGNLIEDGDVVEIVKINEGETFKVGDKLTVRESYCWPSSNVYFKGRDNSCKNIAISRCVRIVRKKGADMIKNDLKNGMGVELRDGLRGVVVNGYICHEHQYTRLSDIRDDLKHNDFNTLDIVKVYKQAEYCGILNLISETCSGDPIWTRQETQEVTLDEIAAKFGVDVENLKIKK